VSFNSANTGSRKHVVLLYSLFFLLPIAAEGRFKSYYVDSPLQIAIVEPSVNGLQLFLNQIVSA
jgi:hypothetical protein